MAATARRSGGALMPMTPSMLAISPEKVCFFIVKTCEPDVEDGKPMPADHLVEGLDQFDISCDL